MDRHRLGATWRLRHEHQTVDEAGCLIIYRNLRQLGRTLQPIFLRRRKAGYLSDADQRRLTCCLMNMRMSCNSTCLLGWDYALFYGGVPSEQRGGLVDPFHTDPACRVFVSTDAGRAHRLGQSKSVQMINFVAERTIEEKTLPILAFKKSLFAAA